MSLYIIYNDERIPLINISRDCAFIINTDVPQEVAEANAAAITKDTLVDADSMVIVDSEAADAHKRITWANIKSVLQVAFDALYVTLTTSQTVSGLKNFTATIKSSGRQQAVTIMSGDYTLTPNDEVVVFTATSTATLPPATGSGQTYRIVARTPGTVTIDGNGSETIKGSITQTLTGIEDLIITDTAIGIWE